MRRRYAVVAEVVRCADDRLPDVVLPETIDHYPGGERVGLVRDPVSELKSAVRRLGIGGRVFEAAVELCYQRQRAGLDSLERSVRLAVLQ